MQSQLKTKETNRLHRNFSSVQSPVLSVHEATVERNDSLLTGRNLHQNQNQGGRPSASTSWGLRGQKRGDNKHRNTIQRIPVGTGKHELMNTIMSHEILNGGKREQSEERWDIRGTPAVWAYSSLIMGCFRLT